MTKRQFSLAETTVNRAWAPPVLLVLPEFLCATFLLRSVGNGTRLSTD